jgi:Peptidase family M28
METRDMNPTSARTLLGRRSALQHNRNRDHQPRRSFTTRAGAAIAAAAIVLGACGSDDTATDTGSAVASETTSESGGSDGVTDTTLATEPAPIDTEQPTTSPSRPTPSAGARGVVEVLASDELGGRDNLTEGSRLAQEYLISQLQEFSQPFPAGAPGADGFSFDFDGGTNLLAVIPGSDLADQYVIVGAHYDHLGSYCDGTGSTDSICNGATDNATGVAAALEVGRALAVGPEPPRRSVIIALWDREEDGLLGSAAYLAAPPIPLAATVAYVNLDLQGANLSPALRGSTVVVGAETGGTNLIQAVQSASAASSLTTTLLSLVFGQARSDHANFATAGVPIVFFTDAAPPCYHTVGDDLSVVDFSKLEQQIATAETLTRELAATDTPPAFDLGAPVVTYGDAVSMQQLLATAEPDFGRFSPDDEAATEQYLIDLTSIVDAGPDAFDAAAGTLLRGAVRVVSAWETGECEGFLEPG